MGELFSTFGIDWKLLAAQSVNFGLLLLILWYFLYRPVIAMIDERRKRIAEGVEKAAAADKRLEDAASESAEIIGRASREGESLVASARARAEEKGSEMVAEANRKADALLKDAAARAQEAERQALRASERNIAKAAMLAAEKILADRK